MTPDKDRITGWLKVWFALALLGILISCYALDHHIQIKIFGRTNAACNINALFNCDRVARSKFSEILGIPLAVFGFSYFFAILTVIGAGLKWKTFREEGVRTYWLLAIIGLCTALTLSMISAFGVKAFCITCMSIYLVCTLQAISLFFFYRSSSRVSWNWNLKKGYILALSSIVAALLFFWGIQETLTILITTPQYSAKINHGFQKFFGTVAKDIPIHLLKETDLASDIWRGNPEAPVTVVEFIDHMCPSCQSFAPILNKAEEEFGNRLLVVLKQFPMEAGCNPLVTKNGHPYACLSAIVARCAWKEGKYWDFQKRVFKLAQTIEGEPRPSDAGPPTPLALRAAKDVGISDENLGACLNSNELKARVKDDIELGLRLGIDSTPGIFVNGWRLDETRAYSFLRDEILYRIGE